VATIACNYAIDFYRKKQLPITVFQTWSFAFLSKEAMVFNNTNSLWLIESPSKFLV
jgi:hypothetical protein